jgi:hypothetical protein
MCSLVVAPDVVRLDRRPDRLEALCWTGVRQQCPIRARVRTLARTGLSLDFPQQPEPVPFLIVQLTNRRRGTLRRFRVRVLYALHRGEEGCVIGASFPERLAAEELEALIS